MRRPIPFTVEKNRVLVPVGKPCVFGCRYCYTRGKELGLARATPDDILSDLKEFASETSFETIQFGYDSDPFSQPERGIAMLRQLAQLRKHVNFSTKALVEGATLEALERIREQMEETHMKLSALVSLSCWDSGMIVEPHTPSPRERIVTVSNLKRIGIPTFIAVRPILPHIHDSEYERVVEEAILAGCDGFILGPLYSDEARRFVRFIPPAALANVPRRTGRVSWSPHAPVWTRYEDPDRLQRLLAMVERKGGRTFLSSADAVSCVQEKEPVA